MSQINEELQRQQTADVGKVFRKILGEVPWRSVPSF